MTHDRVIKAGGGGESFAMTVRGYYEEIEWEKGLGSRHVPPSLANVNALFEWGFSGVVGKDQ